MASGLIQQPMHEKKRPEDVGAGYINILSQKSFFNCKPRGPDEASVYYYVKHDLLYELALESAATLEIRMISHLKYLRTLIIHSAEFYSPEPDHLYALNEMLKGLKSLRLFSLNVYILHKLPDQIGSLIHLRYLSLRQRCSNKNLLHFFSHPMYGLVFKTSSGSVCPVSVQAVSLGSDGNFSIF